MVLPFVVFWIKGTSSVFYEAHVLEGGDKHKDLQKWFDGNVLEKWNGQVVAVVSFWTSKSISMRQGSRKDDVAISET